MTLPGTSHFFESAMSMSKNNVQNVDVVIIGCGIAGLSAGLRLLELNPSYRIAFIEARDRVGGRTETQNVQLPVERTGVQVPGSIKEEINDANYYTIDVGGQWLGPMHTEMLSLVKSLGIKLMEQEYPNPPPLIKNTCSKCDIQSTTTSSSSSSRLVECAYYSFPPLNQQAQKGVQKFHQYLQQSVNKLNPQNPLTYPNAQHLDTISAAQVVDEMIVSDQGREEIYFYIQTILAVSPSQCSWLFFLFYVASGGGVDVLGDGEDGAQKYKVQGSGGSGGGAGNIAKLMLDKIRIISSTFYNRKEIRNNCQSQQEQSSIGIHLQYSVHLIEQIGEVEDEDENENEKNDSDYKVTVFAFSTADEKTNTNSHSHEIRYRAKRVIVAIPLTLCITSLTFKPPLPESKSILYSKISPGGVFKVIVCYPKGTTFGFGKCRPLKELGFVHNIFASQVGKYPSLVGLITGPAADRFQDLNDENKKAAVISQYSSMYCLDDIQPITCIIRDWTKSEQYSGGCFAGVYPPTANSTFVTNFQELARPFGRIHFAGTETSNKFYGYMEGARLSGLRAATEVDMALTQCNEVNAKDLKGRLS